MFNEFELEWLTYCWCCTLTLLKLFSNQNVIFTVLCCLGLHSRRLMCVIFRKNNRPNRNFYKLQILPVMGGSKTILVNIKSRVLCPSSAYHFTVFMYCVRIIVILYPFSFCLNENKYLRHWKYLRTGPLLHLHSF